VVRFRLFPFFLCPPPLIFYSFLCPLPALCYSPGPTFLLPPQIRKGCRSLVFYLCWFIDVFFPCFFPPFSLIPFSPPIQTSLSVRLASPFSLDNLFDFSSYVTWPSESFISTFTPPVRTAFYRLFCNLSPPY